MAKQSRHAQHFFGGPRGVTDTSFDLPRVDLKESNTAERACAGPRAQTNVEHTSERHEKQKDGLHRPEKRRPSRGRPGTMGIQFWEPRQQPTEVAQQQRQQTTLKCKRDTTSNKLGQKVAEQQCVNDVRQRRRNHIN